MHALVRTSDPRKAARDLSLRANADHHDRVALGRASVCGLLVPSCELQYPILGMSDDSVGDGAFPTRDPSRIPAHGSYEGVNDSSTQRRGTYRWANHSPASAAAAVDRPPGRPPDALCGQEAPRLTSSPITLSTHSNHDNASTVTRLAHAPQRQSSPPSGFASPSVRA